MKYQLTVATILAALPAAAATITFSFTNPAGDVGSNTHTYGSTPSGYSLTAYGYRNGSPVNLYGKNGGGDENGLGLVGTSDFEIGGNAIILLDISQLQGAQSLQLSIGSVQSSEGYKIYGENQLNGSTTLLVAGNIDGAFFTVPGFSQFRYIGVGAGTGDVLLDAVRFTAAPEPATFVLVGVALVGVSLLRRSRKPDGRAER